MRLSDPLIDEFIILYEKHHGVVLSRDDALEKGMQLCRFVELVDFSTKEVEVED